VLTDVSTLPEPRFLREKDWDTLVWSLQQRNCILLLGPELASEGDGQETTLTGDLARHLAADLSPQYSHLRELPRVASLRCLPNLTGNQHFALNKPLGFVQK
jgi:hypothetical protein